jgi:tRNA-Thr(GGU) m(6)t(6)A37 methyltransferase TsaA
MASIQAEQRRRIMENIDLKPIGVVRSADRSTAAISLQGTPALIEIFPQYLEGLERIEEHSHLWVLSWFHEAKRNVLATAPVKVNPDAPRYGVFALRTPMRPNPIGLTLVVLQRVKGNILHVTGLDAVDGTPVLDVKPYFEQDIVFSPLTAKITPVDHRIRKEYMEHQAMQHHREACLDSRIGIRMALIAEEVFGKLNTDEISVEVTGSGCLADVLQGLTRARLASPPRFRFYPSSGEWSSAWTQGDRKIVITLKVPLPAVPDGMTDSELFDIERT